MRQPRISTKGIVRKRAHNSCEKCGVKIVRKRNGTHNGSIHHRRPRRMGGLNTISNMVLLCLGCHRAIHRDEAQAATKGWIVWTDAEVTPMVRRGRWTLLVPDGSLEYLSRKEGKRLCAYMNGSASNSSEGLAISA